MSDAMQLTGHELDEAVAVEVMGFSAPIQLSIRKGKPPYTTYFKTAPKELRWAKNEWGQRYTIDGKKVYCGEPFNIYCVLEYGDDPRLSDDVEAEIERRGLVERYIPALHEMVIPSSGDGIGAFAGGVFSWADVFAFRRATPEQICRAALMAVRGEKEASRG